MSDDIRDKWNARYRDAEPSLQEPVSGLRDYIWLLPQAGAGLDLACGRGGNALFLAAQGLNTQAWDIADVAIDQLRRQAAARGLSVDARVRDVVAEPPAPDSFDVIVVSYFLERDLMAALQAALRPGGLLFYQTFTREAVDATGPRNPAWRLGRNELLQLLPELDVLVYEELGVIGDVTRGLRNQALFIGTRL